MIPNLDLWLVIVIWVFGGIFCLYILLLLVDLILIGCFEAILHHHNKAMRVILMTKFDNIKKILAVFDKAHCEMGEKVEQTLARINIEDFVEQDTPECGQARADLTYLRSEIFYLSRQNPQMEGVKEFKMAQQSILEMDVVYRNAVAKYNADVLGYNYWIRFMPFRWLFLLLKVKEKNLI